MVIRSLIIFLFTAATASAIPWNLTLLNSGTEAGAVSAVAVDSAGQIHTVYSVLGPASKHDLIYQMRSNGSSGFTAVNDDAAVVATELTTARPLHVSIDVTDRFVVQIAMVDAAGVVRVFEQRRIGGNPLTWNTKVVSELASTDGDGGISLRSRGKNGVSFSALTFTKQEDGVSGGVQFSQQEFFSSWSTPIDVFTGIGTGRAPVLVNTGFNFAPHMILSYNAAANRIQATSFAARAPDFTTIWRAPEEVAPAFTATRLDAEARGGLIGVAFVSNATDLGESAVRYASDDLTQLGSWVVSDVAPASDVDPSANRFFGKNAALAFDAERNPWVSYTHEVGTNRSTLEIHARRSLPGIGWEDSVVEGILPAEMGLAQTDSLSLSAGDNGDPTLVYERHTLTSSDFVVARPVAAPWQLKRALDVTGPTQQSTPALASSADGSLHLAYTDLAGSLHVSSFIGSSETAETVVSPGFHQFIAMESTPDGALHLVAVRKENVWSTTAELVYSRRPSGGAFSTPEIVEGRPLVLDGAETLPVVLRSDAAGALHIMYNPADRGLRLLKKKGLADSWTDQTLPLYVNPQPHFELAVRADGGYAFVIPSRVSGTSFFTLWTNIDPLTAELTEDFEAYQWSFPETISDVGCVILPDGRAAGAVASGGDLRFVYPYESGVYSAEVQGDRGGFPDATIALENVVGGIRLIAYSSLLGGSLSDLRISPRDPAGYEAEVQTFAQPKLGLAPVSSESFGFAIDSAGFPVIAVSLASNPGTALESHNIYLARPADALDTDGDTIPLLLEGAYDLDPYSPDPLSLLPRAEVLPSPDELVIRHFFRFPRVPRTGLGAKGEYAYRYEASEDLRHWFEEVVVPGQINIYEIVILPAPGVPVCEDCGIESRYYGGFLDENKRRFTRVRVFRDR